MNKLNEAHKLFEQLKINPPNWWSLLVSDKDTYIDIRKENYIDIYYNGGGLLKELKYTDRGLKGNTNYKYLLTGKPESVGFSFHENKLSISDAFVNLLRFEDIDKNNLKRIKANISNCHAATSEKGIQARFIKNAGGFIDSEFAYNYEDIKLRIDLVWIDKKNKKINFVELKTMGDSRLFNRKITEQLSKYFDFTTQYETQLLEYYKKVFRIKKRLKILPAQLQGLDSLDGYTIERKPLLLFGDCEQEWININAEKINERINKVAIGAYYFGNTSSNCDIIHQSKKGNRYTFH